MPAKVARRFNSRAMSEEKRRVVNQLSINTRLQMQSIHKISDKLCTICPKETPNKSLLKVETTLMHLRTLAIWTSIKIRIKIE